MNVMRDGVSLPQGAGSDVRERTGDVEYSESSERFGRVMNAKRNEALDWRSVLPLKDRSRNDWKLGRKDSNSAYMTPRVLRTSRAQNELPMYAS